VVGFSWYSVRVLSFLFDCLRPAGTGESGPALFLFPEIFFSTNSAHQLLVFFFFFFLTLSFLSSEGSDRGDRSLVSFVSRFAGQPRCMADEIVDSMMTRWKKRTKNKGMKGKEGGGKRVTVVHQQQTTTATTATTKKRGESEKRRKRLPVNMHGSDR
jgi:hypothetical protein